MASPGKQMKMQSRLRLIPRIEKSSRARLGATVGSCAVLLLACSGSIGGTPEGSGASAGVGGGAGSPTGTGGTGGKAPSSGGSHSTAGAMSAAGSASVAGSSSTAGAGGGLATPVDIGVIATNPPPFQPASGMLRRLTRKQFANAVRDIFGVETNTSELDADSFTGSFAAVGASSVVTSERGVEQYHTAIEAAVDTVFADNARRFLAGESLYAVVDRARGY